MNNTKKESNAKLALSRCSRGITKRKALGNIGNNVIIKANRNDDNKCDKKLDTKVNLRKKIEASKVLIGLKAKKSQTHTIKPIIDLPVTAIDNKKDAEIGRIIPPVKNDQNKEIPFSLPEGVDNIDTECTEDPQMCAENAQKIITYIRNLETKQDIKPKFLAGSIISGKMRAVLINWLAEVHLQFKLMQETLYLTVGIVDRYLAIEGHLIKKPKIQLVGVCAMLIACKYEEMYIPQVEDFVYISDEAYKAQEILSMERHILEALKYELGRPIAITFLRRNSKAGSVDDIHHWLSKYILEACLVEYDLAHELPSKMAAGALLLLLKLQSPQRQMNTLWTANLAYYSGYKAEHLLEIIKKMATVMKEIHTSKFNAAYVKYNSSSHQKVASLITENSIIRATLTSFAQGHFQECRQ